MLTIKDLAASKTLDREDMQRVKGGQGLPNIFSEAFTHQRFSELWNMQSNLTEQSNVLAQSANVGSVVEGKGHFVDVTGGFNSTTQGNYSSNGNG